MSKVPICRKEVTTRHMKNGHETFSEFGPQTTWTEVLPRLWIGGTDDDDVLGYEHEEPVITLAKFDTVITLHAWSNPVDWHVREIRQPFHDAQMADCDLSDLWFVATNAYQDWMNGRRVLVRCLSGLNRSALVVSIVLMWAGYTAEEAITHLRKIRSRYVLCNGEFERWLLALELPD